MEIIQKYFNNLSDEQRYQFGRLQGLYEELNQKVNVVSRKDIQNLYERHVLHSLAIAKVTNFQPGSKILDIGTGGGFPGIPLAILFPKVEFVLVDSIGKKIKVVEEVAERLLLQNVEGKQTRAEKLDDSFDFVVSRAVAKIDALYYWVRPLLSPYNNHELKNGLLCLKGGDLKEEFASFKKFHRFYELSKMFDEPFFESKKIVYAPR